MGLVRRVEKNREIFGGGGRRGSMVGFVGVAAVSFDAVVKRKGVISRRTRSLWE